MKHFDRNPVIKGSIGMMKLKTMLRSTHLAPNHALLQPGNVGMRPVTLAPRLHCF